MNNKLVRKSKTGIRVAAIWAVAIGLLGGGWPELATSVGSPHKRVTSAARAARAASAAVYDDGSAMMGANSRAALTVKWWRWVDSIPLSVDPTSDTTGVNCAINQQGDDWFIVGPATGNFAYTCTVPADKAIVTGVYTFLDDYPCPPDQNFEPAPGQSLQDFLSQDIGPLLDGVVVVAQLDGRPLKVRRILSPLFSFTAAANVIAFDSCITGSPQLGVSDGYFVFIEPPPGGDHVLGMTVTLADGSSGSAAVNLKIR